MLGVAEVSDYLSGLMNRPVDAHAPLRLSSAQRARFSAWLGQHATPVDETVLHGEFTLQGLLAGSPADQGARACGAAATSAAARNSTVSPPGGFSLGIDIQNVEELLRNVNRNDFKADPELVRMFTLRELSYAHSSPTPDETLAGIFAAKEAIRKCTPRPFVNQEEFQSIEVLPDNDGRPHAKDYEISISHSGGFAVAVACRSATAGPFALRDAVQRPDLPDRGSPRLHRPLLLLLIVLIGIFGGLLAELLISH